MKNFVFLTIAILIFLSLIIIFRPAPSKMRRDLFLADSLMQINPDSSLRILQKIGDRKKFSEEDNALYALLKTQSLFRNRIPVTSDSLIRIAVNYYDNSADSLHKAWSNFYLGRIRETTVNKEEALICYQKALSAASGTEDYKLLGMIYNYLGLMFRYVKPHDEGINYFEKALKYIAMNRDTVGQIYVLNDLATSYILKKEYAKSLQYYREGIRLARIIKKESLLCSIYNNMGILYNDKKKYPLALEYATKALSFDEESRYKQHKYFLKSNIFKNMGQYDSARYYIQKAGLGTAQVSRAAHYLLFSEIEGEVRNYKDAYNYLKRYVSYFDSLDDTRRYDAIVALQKKYDYSLIENENSQLKIARQHMHIIILLISLIAITAVTLLIYYSNKKRTVKKGMKEDVEKMKSDLISQSLIQTQKQTIQLQKQQNDFFMREEVLGLHLSQKTEELKMHLQKERILKEYIFKMDAIVQKIDSLDSLKAIQRSKSESEFTLSFQELSNLEEAVNICYDNFANRLRQDFPKLKDDDIHLCCLLKMKVPNRNILSLLDTNELTLKKRRYRIKRDKMELPDEVVSLDDFISVY